MLKRGKPTRKTAPKVPKPVVMRCAHGLLRYRAGTNRWSCPTSPPSCRLHVDNEAVVDLLLHGRGPRHERFGLTKDEYTQVFPPLLRRSR